MKKGKLKQSVAFRNPQLFNSEIKAVTLERVLTNLYLLLSTNGMEVNLGTKSGITIDKLKEWIKKLSEKGQIHGAVDNNGQVVDAVEDWLRSNLVNLVFRGNVVKENVAALRPMHLMSYRVQNRKFNRDYNTSDQVYTMLGQQPQVKNVLKKYLCRGYDATTNTIVGNADLDVDTTCILMLSQNVSEKKKPNTQINEVTPLLKAQAELMCDDLRRLLVYADLLPRNVFIDYLRILIGFHLGLYLMKMIHLLPKMRQEGKIDVEDDWSLVIDLSDNLDTKISPIACQDMERMINGLHRYFHTTFEVNAIQAKLKKEMRPASIADTLKYLQEMNNADTWFQVSLGFLIDEIAEDEEERAMLADKLKYFPIDDYFNRYIHLVELASGGSAYQFKYHKDFIDKVMMKNTESKLLADGRRSKRHPRRGAMGSKLLEVLVQLLVLEPDASKSSGFASKSLSIDELASLIRQRYGLIINGVSEPRFANADVDTNAAFRENMTAFKDKLRQIGFYTDLSDACLLQKIRPRYSI
ncbi:MAG: hypothetical protein NC453_14515 [Muribaculum sp.]|nr:hypothetical protein [Muribaculum sp.]